MEAQTSEIPGVEFDSPVDASRPFRSVKEAVAMFGERLLTPPRSSLDKETSTPPRFSLDKEISDSFSLPQSPNKPLTRDLHSSPKPLAIDKLASESPLIIPRTPDITPIKDVHSSPKPSRFAIETQTSDLSMPMHIAAVSPTNVGKQVVDVGVNEPPPSLRNSENESHGNIVHENDLVMMLMVIKKFESELQETKKELKLLKERESETEVALASLNAELHKNMSKIAKVEAVQAAKAAAAVVKTSVENGKQEMGTKDEDKSRDVMLRSLDSPTIAQILSISDYEGYFRESKKVSHTKLLKKKPIIPLVTDIIPWKKRSPPTNDLWSPLYSSNMYSA